MRQGKELWGPLLTTYFSFLGFWNFAQGDLTLKLDLWWKTILGGNILGILNQTNQNKTNQNQTNQNQLAWRARQARQARQAWQARLGYSDWPYLDLYSPSVA
jgi:hypothetical protein